MHLELGHQLIELRITHKVVEHDDLRLGAVFVEHVLEAAEPRSRLITRNSRKESIGVGDNTKVLAEEMAQRAVPSLHRRQQCAHRASFLPPSAIGVEHFQLFDGVARGT